MNQLLLEMEYIQIYFQEATDLALLLRSALPTPLAVVEETVGPDLGEDSIKSGVVSLVVGFALVILFMFYKYKLFGLVANTALIKFIDVSWCSNNP